MLGAIYGDKVGSIYEYDQIKNIKEVNPDKLILPNSFYSDDTIETIAIMDSIVNSKSYEETLKEYILKYENYKPNFEPYFKNAFSLNTIKWAHGIGNNNSKGNGAMMRISPVGYLFDSEKDVIENAYLATSCSHNSEEAITSSKIIALMIFYFRNGLTKDEVYKKLNLIVKYIPFKKFNTTCYDTLGNCLYAIYNSTSLEDGIRKTLLMGGDTDTNCCIVSSVLESIYKMDELQKFQAKENLPDEFIKILNKVYE